MNEASAKACADAIRVETADLRRKLAAAEAKLQSWLSVFGHLSHDPDEAGNLIVEGRREAVEKAMALADRLGEALAGIVHHEGSTHPASCRCYFCAALAAWRAARGGNRG